jgi:hypothetical protein
VNRIELARDAVRKAARLRADLGLGPAQPICPFDIAAQLGITVRLDAIPSLEGMYCPGSPPAIVVTSLRPAGRRRFTCGHEIGHHLFGHGYRLDEVTPARQGTTAVEEFVADRFAAALLMPKLAVENAFVRRGWRAASPATTEVFIVAQDLGVGFTTLIDHMSVTLRILGRTDAAVLSKTQLPRLRAQLAGRAVVEDLFPLDSFWGQRPLDVEIGDQIVLPQGAEVQGAALAGSDGRFVADAAGAALIALPGRPEQLEVRVSRREFVGLAQYRYLEDCDE